MKTLIIYDSYFGNTEKIAKSIGEGLGSQNVEFSRVGEISSGRIKEFNLLIVGSPTRAFRPTKPITDFIKSIPKNELNGVKVAAFDTGISREDTSVKFLKIMIGLFGYAAKPLAKMLTQRGGELISEPQGFFVADVKGPLKEGELDRAKDWSKTFKIRK